MQNTEAWFAGDNVYRIEMGDEDGIRMIDPATGVPMFGVADTCLPEHVVFDRDGDHWWVLSGSETHLSLDGNGMRLLFADVRSFGLYAHEIQNMSPREMLDVLLKAERPQTFQVKDNADGTKTVMAVNEPKGKGGPQGESLWEIDPKKDNAITKVVLTLIETDGSRQLLAEANTQYARMDGRWWPSRTESLCPKSGWYCCVEYQHAEFDKPDHPKKITPDLMGVPFGTTVYAPKIALGQRCAYLGDGAVASPQEWWTISQQHDLTPAADWAARRRLMGGGEYPTWWDAPDGYLGLENLPYRPDAWEIYVRRWIIKRTSTVFYSMEHPLDEKQISAAWAILKDSRARTEPIRRRVDRELAEIEQVLRASDPQTVAAQLVSDHPAAPTEVAAIVDRRLAAEKRRAVLEKPKEFEVVFQQLKDRLQRLLTTAQQPEPVRPRDVPPPGPYRPIARQSGRAVPLSTPSPARP